MAAISRLLLLLLCLLPAACAGSKPALLHSADNEAVSRMVTDLSSARIIFVGEFHDQRYHHLLQLQLLRELQQRGVTLAIGLEMFDLEKQPLLDDWVQGKTSLQEFVSRYRQAWSINWAEYDTILLFARNEGVPLVALDAPAELVRLIAHGGPQALGYDAAQRLPDGVTTVISPSYRDFMALAFRTHAMPDGMFANFCAAQGLRNSTMAKRIAGYLEQHPERTMVVLAGVGHAMRRGVPVMTGREGLSSRIVLPQVDGLYEALERSDMDYLVSYGE